MLNTLMKIPIQNVIMNYQTIKEFEGEVANQEIVNKLKQR